MSSTFSLRSSSTKSSTSNTPRTPPAKGNKGLISALPGRLPTYALNWGRNSDPAPGPALEVAAPGGVPLPHQKSPWLPHRGIFCTCLARRQPKSFRDCLRFPGPSLPVVAAWRTRSGSNAGQAHSGACRALGGTRGSAFCFGFFLLLLINWVTVVDSILLVLLDNTGQRWAIVISVFSSIWTQFSYQNFSILLLKYFILFFYFIFI